MYSPTCHLPLLLWESSDHCASALPPGCTQRCLPQGQRPSPPTAEGRALNSERAVTGPRFSALNLGVSCPDTGPHSQTTPFPPCFSRPVFSVHLACSSCLRLHSRSSVLRLPSISPRSLSPAPPVPTLSSPQEPAPVTEGLCWHPTCPRTQGWPANWLLV